MQITLKTLNKKLKNNRFRSSDYNYWKRFIKRSIRFFRLVFLFNFLLKYKNVFNFYINILNFFLKNYKYFLLNYIGIYLNYYNYYYNFILLKDYLNANILIEQKFMILSLKNKQPRINIFNYNNSKNYIYSVGLILALLNIDFKYLRHNYKGFKFFKNYIINQFFKKKIKLNKSYLTWFIKIKGLTYRINFYLKFLAQILQNRYKVYFLWTPLTLISKNQIKTIRVLKKRIKKKIYKIK